MNIAAQDEFDFTTRKIQQNFSNYSAWHYRSELLLKSGEIEDLLEKGKAPCTFYLLSYIINHYNACVGVVVELALVQKAVYTEPGDQSAWMYHHWLIGKGNSLIRDPDKRNSILAQELRNVQELHELEPDCKWPLFALTLLLLKMKEYDEEAVRENLKRLEELDPLRKGHYATLLTSLQ